MRWELVNESWRAPNVATALIRRSAFAIVGPFDESVAGGDDVDWLLRAKEAGVREAQVEAITLHYRRHGGNMTNDVAADQSRLLRVLGRAVGASPRRGRDGAAAARGEARRALMTGAAFAAALRSLETLAMPAGACERRLAVAGLDLRVRLSTRHLAETSLRALAHHAVAEGVRRGTRPDGARPRSRRPRQPAARPLPRRDRALRRRAIASSAGRTTALPVRGFSTRASARSSCGTASTAAPPSGSARRASCRITSSPCRCCRS